MTYRTLFVSQVVDTHVDVLVESNDPFKVESFCVASLGRLRLFHGLVCGVLLSVILHLRILLLGVLLLLVLFYH
jgi:hypothetical protein